jgi:hypothetical protein
VTACPVAFPRNSAPKGRQRARWHRSAPRSPRNSACRFPPNQSTPASATDGVPTRCPPADPGEGPLPKPSDLGAPAWIHRSRIGGRRLRAPTSSKQGPSGVDRVERNTSLRIWRSRLLSSLTPAFLQSNPTGQPVSALHCAPSSWASWSPPPVQTGQGHRALCPFTSTIAVVSLTTAQWSLRGAQLPHRGPATYTTRWDATSAD